MFETIIALTAVTTRRLNSAKVLKTFASYNWDSVEIEINCRPQKKKNNKVFSSSYTNFELSPKQMVQCKKTPLESILINGTIGNSKLEITCIFMNGTSHWFEARVQGINKNTLEIIEKQLLNRFKE